MADESTPHIAEELFEPFGRRYDRYAAIVSLGQEARWRGELVRRCPVPADGIAFDGATGTGAVAFALARRYGCKVVGNDVSTRMLEEGRRRAESFGLAERVLFEEGRIESVPRADAAFDTVVFTYALRYVDDPVAAVREMVRIAKPGAPIGYLDSAVPRFPVRLLWEVQTRAVIPLLGRLVAPGSQRFNRFVRESLIEYARRYPSPGKLFEEAGVEDVDERRLSLGAAVVVSGRRPAG